MANPARLSSLTRRVGTITHDAPLPPGECGHYRRLDRAYRGPGRIHTSFVLGHCIHLPTRLLAFSATTEPVVCPAFIPQTGANHGLHVPPQRKPSPRAQTLIVQNSQLGAAGTRCKPARSAHDNGNNHRFVISITSTIGSCGAPRKISECKAAATLSLSIHFRALATGMAINNATPLPAINVPFGIRT